MKIFLSVLFCVGSPGTGCGPKSVSLHTIFTRNLFRGNLRHKIGQKEFIGLSRLGESISPDLTSGICRTCAWKWVETIWLVGTIAVQTQGIPKSGLRALCEPKCPLTEEWIKKMCYRYSMKYYPAIKKNEIMPFAAILVALENVILSEVSQRKRKTRHPLYVESKKK